MKKLVFTHSINGIVSKFTSLFLATYFLKITNGNIVSVVLYYLCKFSLNCVFSFISLKIISKENLIKSYRLGLLSNSICLFILLVVGEEISKYIYLYAIIDSLTGVFYWSSYKLILYNFKNYDEYKNNFSYNNIVSSIISIVSTIGMGYAIVNASYSFVITVIISLMMLALFVTYKFDDYKFEFNKIKMKNIKYIFKDYQSRQICKLLFFEGMGFGGGIDTVITLIIFFTLGSEASLGNLNALFGLLGLITTLLVKNKLKEKNNKKSFIIADLKILISSVPIIFSSSFKMFIIYNIVFNISYKVIQILINIVTFNIHSNNLIKKYYSEYIYVTEVIFNIGKVFSESILLFVVINSFNLKNLRLIAAFLSISIIFEMFIYCKSLIEKNSIKIL